MGSTMNRIVLDRGANIEPRLLKSETQSTSASEQIDSNSMSRHVIET
jgi:hypothetical protein